MWCVARFGTIYTIYKTGKTPLKELKPATLLKVTLFMGIFTFFKLYKGNQIAQSIAYHVLTELTH